MENYSYSGKLWVIIVCAMFFAACETFIPDLVDPRLSLITEDGRDVSSALINNEPWIAKGYSSFAPKSSGYNPNHHFVCQIENDTLFWEIDGKIGETPKSIGFVIIGRGLKEASAFEKLSDKKLQIDGNNVYAVYDGEKFESGQIYFRRVESSGNSCIISGTFGFTTTSTSIKVSYGRFDIKISKDENFKIK